MNTKMIKVLSIEDNPGDARLIQVMLFDARSLGWDMPRFELEHVGRLEAGLARLEMAACHPELVEGSSASDIDVVLTDLDLPDSKAGDTFATLHARFPHVPIVVLTGREDETLAVNTVRAGAEDYLYKREMSGTLLAHALSYAVERQRAKDALQRAHDALEERVRDRTIALAQANERLQRELEARERAEAEVRMREVRYRTLVDQAADMLLLHDMDGNIVDVNQASVQRYGYGREELLSMRVADLDPDYVEREDAGRFWEQFGMNEPFHFEARQQNKNGEVFPVDVVLSKVRLHGQVFVMGLCRDITERKQAEMALQESEARFRSIFELVNDAIWILDPAGHLLQVNAIAAELLGYTKETMCGNHVSEFLPPDEAAGVSARLAHIRDRGQAMFETQHLRKDGTRLPVEVNVKMAEFGDERVLLSVIRDISARKWTEARLAYLNAVLRAIRNVNQLITQESDRDRLLQRACETLVETLGFHNAWIALAETPHDEVSRRVTAMYVAGCENDFVPMTQWLRCHGLPACGRSALTQETVSVITAPVEACADCPLAADDPTRGCVATRLMYRERVYGVLTVSIPMRYVRDTEVHALIDEVAGDLAFALWRLESEAARRRAEDALRRSERELQLTLDATTDGIWKWNFKTDELHFSPRYYTMLGYEPGEFPATYEHWARLIHPEDRAAALAVAEAYLATKPDVYRNEFRMRTKDGGYRWIQTVAKVVERDVDGEAVRMIGHHRDISARKRAEEALEAYKAASLFP